MPEYHFTNEMGQAISLSDFKGQAVALTFLFTRCPYPTFCPRMASNLDETYKKLKGNPSAPTNWHLFAITFDPQFDTPAILKSYAKRYTYDPAKWNYLTGDLIDITAITEQFGLLFWPVRPGPGHGHQPQPAHGRNRRRWQSSQNLQVENSWKVDDLATEIIKAAVPKS